MSVAAERKATPAQRENASTQKAIAKAAAAWSLGNEGSGEGADRRCVAATCVVNGRGRSHTWATTWFASRAIPAATSADTLASLQRETPGGLDTNQSATVAAAYSGTASVANVV